MNNILEVGELYPAGPQGPKGDKGDKGDAPVSGTDYWTEEDKNEIKTYCNKYIDTQILEAIGGEY